jgi:hypothetical protein
MIAHIRLPMFATIGSLLEYSNCDIFKTSMHVVRVEPKFSMNIVRFVSFSLCINPFYTGEPVVRSQHTSAQINRTVSGQCTKVLELCPILGFRKLNVPQTILSLLLHQKGI